MVSGPKVFPQKEEMQGSRGAGVSLEGSRGEPVVLEDEKGYYLRLIPLRENGGARKPTAVRGNHSETLRSSLHL